MDRNYRVRQKFSYWLVLRTSIILNLVVRNPRVLVQKVLLKTQKQSGIYFTAYYHIISLFAGKLTGLVTKARFLSQMELVKKQMIEMAVEWRSFKGIFNLILTSMRFAFMTIRYFNPTVIWSQLSSASVFFLTKNVLVPWLSYVKGLIVRTVFLPVPDNRT